MRRIDMLMQTIGISNCNNLMSELIDAIAFVKTYRMHNLYNRPSVAVKRKQLLKL
mgnify:CR=1 FL=1